MSIVQIVLTYNSVHKGVGHMKLERLADLRESNNWTQKYVANYLKVTQRSYGHYENGTRSLPLEALIKLSELYNVSTDYMLGITDVKEPYPKPEKKRYYFDK